MGPKKSQSDALLAIADSESREQRIVTLQPSMLGVHVVQYASLDGTDASAITEMRLHGPRCGVLGSWGRLGMDAENEELLRNDFGPKQAMLCQWRKERGGLISGQA